MKSLSSNPIKRMALSVALSLTALAGCSQSPRQVPVRAEQPPVPRLAEFEDSAFCKKYHCQSKGVRLLTENADPKVSGWIYEYRLEGNDLMEIELWLSAKGVREHTYIRWSPINIVEKDVKTPTGFTLHTVTRIVPEKEILPVRDLVNQMLRSKQYDASEYVENHLLSFWDSTRKLQDPMDKKFPRQNGKFVFSCSYQTGGGEQPELDLDILEVPISEKHV